MNIADKNKERSTIILAVISLVVIGLTVLLYTLQTFRHQREAEEQHLFLTSRAVYMSIERTVRRGPVREGEDRLSPRTSEFFQTLEQDGDVLFVGIVTEHGDKLLTSPGQGGNPVELTDTVVTQLIADGEWHGRFKVGKSEAYIYGKRLAPLLGMHSSLRDALGPPGFLVVGIDMEKSLSAYAGFRKNVLFQGLYILCAVVFTWFLGMRYLARRDQAGKAAGLEQFQATLLDNLPDGLITISPDGSVYSANPAALHILRRESHSIVGQPAANLPANLASCLQEHSQPLWQQITYERSKLEVLALQLEDDRENAWMLIIRDRTQLRRLEQSLADAEKLAAIGTLAAGVAHEVRNPLSSLRGFAQYFVKKLAGKQPEEEYAKTMVREADRLNRVITDLLFLGRPKPVNLQPVDLEGLLQEIAGLLRFDLESRKTEIDIRLDAKTLLADRDALKQALLNLVLNSLDALQSVPPATLDQPTAPPAAHAGGHLGTPMTAHAAERPVDSPLPVGEEDIPLLPALPVPGKGGPLRIRSGLILADKSPAERGGRQGTPEGVFIDVQDLGCGMNEEQQTQAFDAFFTAKASGTGLGLALVKRIMVDHMGQTLIASAPGAGTTIRLYFPMGQTQNAHLAASAGASSLAGASPLLAEPSQTVAAPAQTLTLSSQTVAVPAQPAAVHGDNDEIAAGH
ncbi:PAS domain-containing protein [Desulfovibrio sp. OttesenSCG-928-G15]|nr:PAS domain-containing protein [Desulfovibrio sp. OttesenSCG-928-G15]